MCRFVDGFGSWLEKEMEEKCSFHSHFLPAAAAAALAQCHAISWTLFFFSSLLVFVCVCYSQLCSTLPLPLPWSMSWHWCTTTTDNKVVCSFVSVWQGAPQAGFTHSLTHSLIFFNFILPTATGHMLWPVWSRLEWGDEKLWWWWWWRKNDSEGKEGEEGEAKEVDVDDSANSFNGSGDGNPQQQQH